MTQASVTDEALADEIARRQDLLKANLGDVGARTDLAEAYLQGAQPQQALELFADLSDATLPARTLRDLATALFLLRRFPEAIVRYEDALLADPDNAEAHYGLGIALQFQDQDAEALACFTRALVLDSEYAEAHCAKAQALARLGMSGTAEAFRAALEIDPDYPEALIGLANILLAASRESEALQAFDALIALEPENTTALAGRARTLQKLDRHGEAIVAMQAALAQNATSVDLMLDQGILLLEAGQMESAVTWFEKALAREPQNIRAFYSLSQARPIQPDDPLPARLKERLQMADADSDQDRILLQFALAKALRDIGENEESFAHLLRGNALKRAALNYPEEEVLDLFARTVRSFDREMIAARSQAGDPSPVPIFIVGMPRSGSTLIEQILTSHPDVSGSGEWHGWRDAMAKAGLGEGPGTFPEGVRGLDTQAIRDLGASYVASLTARVGHHKRITDKTLANFAALGLIVMALPSAKIVHVLRDPVDCCLSCFSTLFTGEQPFAFDLGELGRYHAAYEKLMAHWRAALPCGSMLELHYEDVVRDLEASVATLLKYCGLEWDEACLAFHKTKRPVRTASVSQVRRPLYNSSVGRWRPAEHLLQPLLDGLNEGNNAGSAR